MKDFYSEDLTEIGRFDGIEIRDGTMYAVPYAGGDGEEVVLSDGRYWLDPGGYPEDPAGFVRVYEVDPGAEAAYGGSGGE